jgi:hypothetical protein
MASEDKKKSVPAALGLILLSLGMASLIAIRVSNDASAQGLLEGLEREQGDSGDVQSACAPTQTGGGTFDDGVSVGGTSAYDDYDADVEGGDSITTGTTTNATSTTTTGGGGNQSTSEVRDNIQEACIALQVGDTQGALMFLDMALSALGDDGTQGGGNMTNTPAGLTDGTTAGGGGRTTPDGGANIT